MKGLLEKAADSAGTLSAPQVDEVVVDVGGREDIDGRGEGVLLGGEQGLVVEPGPLAEEQLDEQLGAHVAEVLDRSFQPAVGDSAPGGSGGENDPVPAVPTRVSATGDESLVDEPVDGAVRERAAEGPDPADLTVGGEHGAQGPPVRHLLCDQSETDAFGERQVPAATDALARWERRAVVIVVDTTGRLLSFLQQLLRT